MKYRLLFTLLLVATLGYSQATLNTVNTGAGNTKQVWYSLANGVVAENDANAWDLGFSISGFMPSIILNSSKGHQLWLYRNGDKNDWEALDTNGLSSWPQYYNSAKDWTLGAFNRGLNAADELDLGWGKYNFTNHQVVGDSIFILKTSNEEFLKLQIVKLASGTYTVQYANLDGSDEKTFTVEKSKFSGKNFGYYNLSTGMTVDIEPAVEDWDLVFTKYIEMVPTAYPVFGVLINPRLMSSKVSDVNVEDKPEYNSLDYLLDKNSIGYNWKNYDFNNNEYIIEDSTIYVLQIDSQEVWKFYFDSYEGSSTGIVKFYTEKIGANSIAKYNVPTFKMYPNPSNGNVSIINDVNATQIRIVNLHGQKIFLSNNQNRTSLNNLNKGMYIVELISDKGVVLANQKLIVQ